MQWGRRAWIVVGLVGVVGCGTSTAGQPSSPPASSDRTLDDGAVEAGPDPAPSEAPEPSPGSDAAADEGSESPAEPEPEPEPGASETATVALYFADREGVRQRGCDEVRAVEREVTHRGDLPSAAVRMLLAGPTAKERKDGLIDSFKHDGYTHMPELQDLVVYFERVEVVGDVAFVDFSDEAALEYLMYAAACAQATVNSPILHTVRAVAGVTQVRYRVGGKPAPLEGGA